MSDPRIEVIEERLGDVDNIIAVASGKGGVGKSMVACTLAMNLRDIGYRVGLLDLDFTSPSTHIILGVKDLFPEEEKGIIPPLAYDMRYMSITYYAVDEPTPLRGEDVSNAIIELMAITRWEELDYLVIDMPPGIGDATLDMVRFIDALNFLLVTIPSRVAFGSVKKLYHLLKDMNVGIMGILENMVIRPTDYIKKEADELNLEYLGSIDYDTELEESIGVVEELKNTQFYEQVRDISKQIVDRRLD
ncbi:MAG: P-loop NTPase [Candidatus Bathyarchaeia archaeon]